MQLTEKTVESSLVYNGRIIRVRCDMARLPNGKTAQREVVEHPGGVAILPLDADGNVVTVAQFRYPLGKVLTEVPAGKLDPGEDHRLCALRELEEETGLIPDELVYLGGLYLSPGFCNEVLYLYLARGLRQGTCRPDEDEFLEVRKVPFTALADALMTDEIHDAKTMAAVLKAKISLGL